MGKKVDPERGVLRHTRSEEGDDLGPVAKEGSEEGQGGVRRWT